MSAAPAGPPTGGPPPSGGDARGADESRADERRASASFRRTLVRGMAVQVVTLLLLWLLQARYTP